MPLPLPGMFKKAGLLCTYFALVALLLLNGSSHEFIHAFTGHTDTVDIAHHDGKLHFETEHHHCAFLDIAIPAFDHALPDFILPVTLSHYSFYKVLPVCAMQSAEVAAIPGRGPPSVIA